MQKKTRFLKVLFVATAIMLSLSACSSAPNASSAPASQVATATPAASESAAAEPSAKPELTPVTFTLFNGDMASTTQTDITKTEIWPKLVEITKVNLEIEYLMGQDGAQKAGIMIASGDLPDFIIPHNNWKLYFDAGVFVPMNPYLDEFAPNFKKWMGEDGLRASSNAKGEIHSATRDGIPSEESLNMRAYPYAGAFYIANGALKQAGYPMIKDWDTYVNTIREYVKANPTINGAPTIGFSGPSEGWRWVFSSRGAGTRAGFLDYESITDPATGYLEDLFGPKVRKAYKSYTKDLQKLNLEGLLDPEFLSQTYDQYLAKLVSGRVVAFHDEWWESGEQAVPSLIKSGLTDSLPIPMNVLNEGVTVDVVNGTQSTGYWPTMCITTSCEDPKRAVQFIDSLCNEEVQKLVNWGISGVHYDIVDGQISLSDAQFAARQDPTFAEKTGIGMNTFFHFPKPFHMPATYSDGLDWSYWSSHTFLARTFSSTEKEILAKYNLSTFAEAFSKRVVKPANATLEEPEAVRDFNSYWWGELGRDMYLQKAIMAKDDNEFEAIWAEFEAKLDAIDYTAYYAFNKQVVDATKAMNK